MSSDAHRPLDLRAREPDTNDPRPDLPTGAPPSLAASADRGRSIDHRTGYDLWLALLAGDRVWVDGPERPGPRERIAAAFAVGASLGVFTITWVALANRIDYLRLSELTERNQAATALAAVGTVALAALNVRYVSILYNKPARPASFWASVIWRAVAYVLTATAFAVALRHGRAPGAFTIGALVGADSMLTLWALGITPHIRAWVWRFTVSPIHFGALGAMLATAIFSESSPEFTILVLYVSLWTALTGTVITIYMLHQLALHIDRDTEREVADVKRREREHRAHWLHDDVLSEVRLASLRISGGTASPEQVNSELMSLDHRLRLRQLDEVMRDGTPAIFEVVQPHLRRAQNLGIQLDRVPRHDVTHVRLSEREARTLERVLSILFSNATNAGATQLRLDVNLRDAGQIVEIRLTDDAGGFDLAAVPAGHGLHRLIDDLGVANVQRHDAPDGSMMVVRVARTIPRQGNRQ